MSEKCTHCEKTCDRGLELRQNGTLIACICDECQESILTAKFVIDRPRAEDDFRFEGYYPLAWTKP